MGGTLGGVEYLIDELLIGPYLLVLLITLFISSVLLIFNRLKMGPLNFYAKGSIPLKITIIAAYTLFWCRKVYFMIS